MGEQDRFNLQRFVTAQAETIDAARAELRAGRKRSHWMWFIFPQIAGLGLSETSRHYAVRSMDEARAYLAHQVLGPRLLELTALVLAIEDRTVHEVFGSPDDLKLRSCMTLFAQAQPEGGVFARVLERHFGGEADPQTLRLLGKS